MLTQYLPQIAGRLQRTIIHGYQNIAQNDGTHLDTAAHQSRTRRR